MLEAKAGTLAGMVWEALNAAGAMGEKELMKALKTRKQKDLYLALGWLLREGKIACNGEEDNLTYSLK